MKRFKKLRGKMAENEVTQDELAKVIQRSSNYISICFRGQYSFRLCEAYLICDYLHIPFEDFCLYFPHDDAICDIHKITKVRHKAFADP